ncbi:MAG: DUF6794 domain-containing protein [Verrucomicrobiota bacterium]
MSIHHLTQSLLVMLLLGCASKQGKDLARDTFLHPYVEQLKTSISSDELESIKTMAESELILLLHGYGTNIRNQWLHGNRDRPLLQFFHDNGVDDPEAMSMVIIKALWSDLNNSMNTTEQASVKTQRAQVARKRSSYEKLEAEGEAQLAKNKSEFERCYEKHGLPSKNPLGRDPFFGLLVGRDGHVRKIEFFEGASSELKECLQKTIQEFKFSPFTDDEVVTLYILEFPRCRIAERDTLHISDKKLSN